MRFTSVLIRYATFGLAGLGLYLMMHVLQLTHASQNPGIAPPAVPPPAKPYAQSLAGTGLLEALSENVSIGVPVPGLVNEVMVKVSDQVKEGDVLMKIDDRELKAQLITQKANVLVAKAAVDVKVANLDKVQDMLNRLNAVEDKRAISMDDLKNRTNDVLVAKADTESAKAQLLAAEAAVTTSELLLERLIVKAPRAGSILQVNIRPGEFASTQPRLAPLILGDLEKLQVRCDIDEQNAVRVRPGMNAKAYVKGDRDNAIPLSFVRIEPFVIPKTSLTGSSTERVDTRVLQVIYSLQIPQDRALYVGQQVDVFIDAAGAE
jgi:HlyD family secretion protein